MKVLTPHFSSKMSDLAHCAAVDEPFNFSKKNLRGFLLKMLEILKQVKLRLTKTSRREMVLSKIVFN